MGDVDVNVLAFLGSGWHMVLHMGHGRAILLQKHLMTLCAHASVLSRPFWDDIRILETERQRERQWKQRNTCILLESPLLDTPAIIS